MPMIAWFRTKPARPLPAPGAHAPGGPGSVGGHGQALNTHNWLSATGASLGLSGYPTFAVLSLAAADTLAGTRRASGGGVAGARRGAHRTGWAGTRCEPGRG